MRPNLLSGSNRKGPEWWPARRERRLQYERAGSQKRTNASDRVVKPSTRTIPCSRPGTRPIFSQNEEKWSNPRRRRSAPRRPALRHLCGSADSALLQDSQQLSPKLPIPRQFVFLRKADQIRKTPLRVCPRRMTGLGQTGRTEPKLRASVDRICGAESRRFRRAFSRISEVGKSSHTRTGN